jgi:hypothetical protein
MGFTFKTAEERNPIASQPSQEETRIQTLETQLADTQAKLEEVEQFIDENTLLQKFYAWQQIKVAIKAGQIVMNDGITDVDFEEVK